MVRVDASSTPSTRRKIILKAILFFFSYQNSRQNSHEKWQLESKKGLNGKILKLLLLLSVSCFIMIELRYTSLYNDELCESMNLFYLCFYLFFFPNICSFPKMRFVSFFVNSPVSLDEKQTIELSITQNCLSTVCISKHMDTLKTCNNVWDDSSIFMYAASVSYMYLHIIDKVQFHFLEKTLSSW